MPLSKPRKDLKIAVLLPTYGRHEYTEKSRKALCQPGYKTYYHHGKQGLRQAIIDFFNYARDNYDIIAKIDNDCIVPKGWMDKLIDIFENTDVDIISPNVFPSDAALKYGESTEEELGYRRAKIVGGLWCMKTSLLKDIVFDHYDVTGIKGAFPLLKQIVYTKQPKIGWTMDVTVQDIGHWSGMHPEHIKSIEHAEYSREVGRDIAWQPQEA